MSSICVSLIIEIYLFPFVCPNTYLCALRGCDWKYNYKLDGVGPDKNRASTDQLHQFVQFFITGKKM